MNPSLPYLSSPACVHPAAERVDTVRVTLNGKRKTLHLCAYGWSTRYSWGHTAYCPELGIEAKIRYYNRTWEAERFNSVIASLLDKCKMTDGNYRKAKAREARELRAYCKDRDKWFETHDFHESFIHFEQWKKEKDAQKKGKGKGKRRR